MKCFLCNSEAKSSEKLLLVEIDCPHCGKYAYEKTFLTAFDYYFSSFSIDKKEKVIKQMQKLVKNDKVCFIDDFDTSIVEGYHLLEFRDIINKAGLEIAHNNTIDSNWKD